MKRSKLVGIAIVAVAAASGCVCEDEEEVRATAVDVAKLLSQAGRTSNDSQMTEGAYDRGLSCKDDVWLSEIYWPPLGPPRVERFVLVVWDMPTGTLRGWTMPRNKWDRRYWAAELSAEEIGFGCDEPYTTSFFLLAGWSDNKISRPIGFERIDENAVNGGGVPESSTYVKYRTMIRFEYANVPAPDTATYYLQNLFTGATFSADVPAVDPMDSPDSASTRRITQLEIDFEQHGLGARPDVASGVVYKREGVEVTSHCLTPFDETLL